MGRSVATEVWLRENICEFSAFTTVSVAFGASMGFERWRTGVLLPAGENGTVRMATYLVVLEIDPEREDEAEWRLSGLPARIVAGGLRRVKGPDELLGVLALSTPRLEAPTLPVPRAQL